MPRPMMLPVSYRMKPGAPAEAGLVVRIQRFADDRYFAPAGPGLSAWTEEPGEPWPLVYMARSKQLKALIPVGDWDDMTDVVVSVYPAAACDPEKDEPLDWQASTNGQQVDYYGRLSVGRR